MTKLKWSDLFSYGNLVRETIKASRLRVKKVKGDFGLETIKDSSIAGTDGHWNIVPPEEIRKLNRIETSIRRTVIQYSISFPLVKGGRFVPDNSIKEMIAELERLKKIYLKEVDNLLDNYTKLQEQQAPVWRKEILNVNPNADPDFAIDRIFSLSPTEKQLRKKFDVSWTCFAFSAPINKDVADIIDSEEESVKDAVKSLVLEVKNSLLEKVRDLLLIVEKAKYSQKPVTLKTIEAGIRDCERFEKQNVFSDPTIARSISTLKEFLIETRKDLNLSSQDLMIEELKDIEKTITNESESKTIDRVYKKLGSRKII